MRSLLDVALLIALLQEHHAHYDRAHEWWAANRTEGWASCPLTQNGFLRIVPQLRFPKPAGPPDPFALLSDMVATTDHEFWPDDVSLLDEGVIDRKRVLGSKQLTDIYLVALAVKHGGRFVTFDRAVSIHAVRGAEARHLAVI